MTEVYIEVERWVDAARAWRIDCAPADISMVRCSPQFVSTTLNPLTRRGGLVGVLGDSHVHIDEELPQGTIRIHGEALNGLYPICAAKAAR